eukprot:5525602-Pleurochrysis_carterae.AAC.1
MFHSRCVPEIALCVRVDRLRAWVERLTASKIGDKLGHAESELGEDRVTASEVGRIGDEKAYSDDRTAEECCIESVEL